VWFELAANAGCIRPGQNTETTCKFFENLVVLAYRDWISADELGISAEKSARNGHGFVASA